MLGGLASMLVRLVPHIGRSFTPRRRPPNPAAALPQTASQAPTDYCDGLPFEALFAARDALFGPILVMQGASTRQVSGTVAIAAARLSNPASRARRGRMGGQVPVTSPPQVARGIASNSTAGFA
jgi:hypothetical protein